MTAPLKALFINTSLKKQACESHTKLLTNASANTMADESIDLDKVHMLNHTIPPQADCGWIGEAGPGPSYGDDIDDGSKVGFDNDFTKRNMTIMTWNLIHLARMLANGIPNQGNDRRELSDGVSINHDNPECRS